MIIKKNWTRRDFIRTAGLGGAASLLLPFIPQLSMESFAAPSGLKNLILLSTGNGTMIDSWRSNGSGTPFSSGQALPDLQGPILGPLNGFKDNLLLLDGIDLMAVFPTRNSGNGGEWAGNKGHHAHSVLWTGLKGTGAKIGERGFQPKGPSVDQIFYNAKGAGKQSIQSSIWNSNDAKDPRWCGAYDKNGNSLPYIWSPETVFNNVFRDGFGNAVNSDPDLKPRRIKSVDFLRGELRRIRKELPADDRVRLDQHVEGLLKLEERFQSTENSSICEIGAENLPGTTAANYRKNIEMSYSDHFDVITAGLACGQVNTVSFCLAPENPWGKNDQRGGIHDLLNGGLHTTSHESNGTGNTSNGSQAQLNSAQGKMTSYQNFMAKRFKELLEKLEAAQVLEDTLIVWGMGMSNGGAHSQRSNPFVLYQGDNGPLQTNRYHNFGNYLPDASFIGKQYGPPAAPHGGETNNNLLISILHAMGMPEIKQVGLEADLSRAEGLDVTLMKKGGV